MPIINVLAGQVVSNIEDLRKALMGDDRKEVVKIFQSMLNTFEVKEAEIAELKEQNATQARLITNTRNIGADAIEKMARNKIKELEATLTGDKYRDVRSTIKLNLLTTILDENEEQRKECDHDWVSGDNEKVSGALVCLKCHTIKAKES